MPPTCDDWLSVVEPHLRQPLFDPDAVARLRRLAPDLPGDGLAILEVRLASSNAVDLSLRLKTPSQARHMAERMRLPHLRTLLLRWSEMDGAFSPVRSLWLEFDLDQDSAGLPTPIVCAKLAPNVDTTWLLDSLFPALHGKPLTAEQRRLIRFCRDEIPAPGSLLYAFSLLSRPGEALRLEIFGLEPDAITAYLHRIAPRADPRAADLAPLFEGVERIHLSFDIAEEILPRIGLEGSFHRLPHREPGWAGLFDRLVARGLCSPGKRNAALAWPGYDTFWTTPEAWPVRAAGIRGFCIRSLSHVKVVCQPGQELEAKVYLGMEYRASRQLGSSAAEERAEDGVGTAKSSSTASCRVRST